MIDIKYQEHEVKELVVVKKKTPLQSFLVN